MLSVREMCQVLLTRQMLLTRVILPARLWFSFRYTRHTLSDTKNLTNQKRIIKNVIRPSGEHSRPTKEEMNRTCGWNALSI